MDAAITKSPLDVAYWFFNRAEQDKVHIDAQKLHHLLFFAQIKYTQFFKTGMLMPCLFLCDEEGFFEPTLKSIFDQGIPFMPPAKFDLQISDFLEEIWQEFGTVSSSQCSKRISQLPLYSECYKKGTPIIISCSTMIDKINNFGVLSSAKTQSSFQKKVLLSQNGPVWVSRWNPRKINHIDNKGLQ